LPKDDVRYIKWKESLKGRQTGWCKGYTKETHPGIAKISATFKNKKIDNFASWRREMRSKGEWSYSALPRNGDTAELIGVVLGDGHIEQFPRTQSLAIFSNANNPGFVKRYSDLLRTLFCKEPHVAQSQKFVNCIRIRIYQNNISQRLGIPTGKRRWIQTEIPPWIKKDKKLLVRYLRGLYEAEGSFCVHKPTSTYKLLFANRNDSLLNNVFKALQILGFHPHASQYKIQISRKEEVYRCKNLIEFRQY